MSIETDLVKALQGRLAKLGYYGGPNDGDAGSLTEAAVIDFKSRNGLRPRAFIGPTTLGKLFSDQAMPRPAISTSSEIVPWLEEAENLKGIREKVGKGSNPLILDWAQNLDVHYPDDDIPWCGLFVAHCMRVSVPKEIIPNNPLGARNWLQYGQECKPVLGAILVLWRGKRNGWQGHVGFYVGEDKDAYHVLGGNQSNAVTITRISKSRLLGARWPASQPVNGSRVRKNADGTLSTNEV